MNTHRCVKIKPINLYVFEDQPANRNGSQAFSESTQFNPLTPNDLYMSRTAPLTSKRFILYIYSTNVGTEYFKHALYSPFFFSSKCSLFHNANSFGSCIIHILYTGCAKIKKNNSGAKGLMRESNSLLEKGQEAPFLSGNLGLKTSHSLPLTLDRNVHQKETLF